MSNTVPKGSAGGVKDCNMKIKNLNTFFKKFDWFLFLTVCLLIILGVILHYSIALGSQSEQNYLNFQKQIVFFILGLSLMFFIAAFIDYRLFLKYHLVFLIFGGLLLIAVLIFGKEIRGTTGWFDFGLFSVQPVEIVKVFLIIYLAKYLSDKARYIGQLKYLVLSSLGVILLVFLTVLQPDTGSALVLLSLWFVLILITGIKKSHLTIIIVLVVVISLILWLFVFVDYQKQRILVFLNPDLDPLGSGYNIKQAIIAVGSGGFFGKGLAFGSQSQLKFLPESQTDFIFAVLAEELGLAGVLLVLVLFGYLFYKLFSIAKKTRDNFGVYLVLGTLTLFVIQAVVNIGGNLGLLPLTGITLPFISYGGSSLVVNLVLVGLVQSVVLRNLE